MALNKAKLADVRVMVKDSYTIEEIKECKNFEEFFALVDAQNGYEPEWKPAKWKAYFEAVYNEVLKIQ